MRLIVASAGSVPAVAAIEQEQAGPVRTIVLNRPEVLNAFDEAMLGALRTALGDAVADPEVRAIVLTGGARAFCTGEDLRAARRLDERGFRTQITTLQQLATELRDAPTPVIAAVAGPAYGGGLELAVNCDVRVAARSARFACPETKWGLTITNGASLLLRRLVGEGWARELALLGTVVDAEEAHRIGLVTRVVPDDELRAEAGRLGARLAELDAGAVAASKRLLNADPAPWADVLEAEQEAVERGFAAPAVRERLDAFGRER
jgi:enoyl-CoA hydratase/carnithine racemase